MIGDCVTPESLSLSPSRNTICVSTRRPWNLVWMLQVCLPRVLHTDWRIASAKEQMIEHSLCYALQGEEISLNEIWNEALLKAIALGVHTCCRCNDEDAIVTPILIWFAHYCRGLLLPAANYYSQQGAFVIFYLLGVRLAWNAHVYHKEKRRQWPKHLHFILISTSFW